jgi:hypothetical protein
MFETCVPNQKFKEKKPCDSPNFFLNEMIRNIKIHNIYCIILKIRILYNLISAIKKI